MKANRIRKEIDMKVKAYTIVEYSVGNVIAGTSEIIDAVAVEDCGEYYEVTIHSNRVRRYTKKYWRIEII